MPIHDFSYRHWEGQRTQRPPAWILGWTQLRLVVKRRAVKLLLIVSGLFFVAYLVMLYVETMPEDSALAVLRDIPFIRLDAASLHVFMERQRLIHYLLCLAAGAEFIALDRRHKALQIYLARPLRVQDYLLGKALPLVVLLSLTTWIPALLLLVLKSVATASLEWLRDEPWLPLSILGYGWVQIAALAPLTLAVSSLSPSPRLASGQLVAVFLLSPAIAEILNGLTRNESWRLLSLDADLSQLCGWLFDARLPHDVSPWSALFVLAALAAASYMLLLRRVRAVDVVGGA